jgi:hypothetical protein
MVKDRGVGMMRTISGILALFLLAGLFRAYRDGRFVTAQTATPGSATFGERLTDPPIRKVESAGSAIAARPRTPRDDRFVIAQPAPQGSATLGEGLTNPPNWKVEPAASAIAARPRTTRDGKPGSPVASVARYGTVGSSSPPFWGRKKVKPSATAQANLPRVPSVQPPRATSLPNSGRQPKAGQQPVLKVAGGGSIAAVAARSGAAPVAVVDEEHRALFRHAQFLIKAGLAPVAKEPLRQILREVPGTPIAREARLTLDSIQN